VADAAVRSTGGERIVWLDVLRGLALFGIAQINFPSFATGAAPMSALFQAHVEGGPRLLHVGLTFLIETKFYPVFAFLFGYGHALQRRALRAAGRAAEPVLKRRYLALLVLGVFHGLVLFFGDILTMYALAGFVLLLYQDHTPEKAQAAVGRWAAVSVLLMLVAALAQPDFPPDVHASWVEMHQQDVKQLARGDWLDIATLRALTYLQSQLYQLGSFLPQVLMFMSAGIWAAERGVLAEPRLHRRLFWRLIAIGLLVGVPVNATLALLQSGVVDETSAPLRSIDLLEDIGFTLSLFYLGVFGLIAAALEPSVHGTVVRWLAALGRLALTNYLTQSLVMMGLWYLAFDRIERFGAAEAMAVLALLTCLLQMLWSQWYMRTHRQGPFEAAWRRFTYKRIGPSS
jgi:uncharacterized protein